MLTCSQPQSKHNYILNLSVIFVGVRFHHRNCWIPQIILLFKVVSILKNTTLLSSVVLVYSCVEHSGRWRSGIPSQCTADSESGISKPSLDKLVESVSSYLIYFAAHACNLAPCSHWCHSAGFLRRLNPAFHLEKHLSPTLCHMTAVFIIFMQKPCSVGTTNSRYCR